MDLYKGIFIFNIFIFYYFIVISAAYLFLFIMSLTVINRAFKEQEYGNLCALMRSNTLPPITAIIPSFNMENTVVDAVLSVLNCKYPNAKVVVVNDGSEDQTLSKLKTAFHLEQVPCIVQQKLKHAPILGYYVSKTHNVVVIDKLHEGVGPGNALNAGLNACQTPLFATVDADTLIDPDAFNKLIFSLLSVPHSISAGGAVYVLNESKYKNGVVIQPKFPSNLLLGFQACEYLRALLVGRAAFNKFGGALIHSGAFTLFESEGAREVDGFAINNFGPDAEIITHVHAYMCEKEHPYNIHYTPSATAWTEVPATLKAYWKQRVRWQFSAIQAFGMYKQMMFNAKYGLTGLFTYPFHILFEVYGGPIEVLGYIATILAWCLGILNLKAVILFILIAWGFIVFLTIATGFISYLTFNKYGKFSDMFKITLFAFLELLGFRQFNAICRTYATIYYFISGYGKVKPPKEKEPKK